MSKIELLAPAKNLEGGIAAINYGADAVYIGAPKFGARAAVGNSLDEIKELIDYAHKFWARVYIAFNTILYEEELQEASKMIHRLYEMGADALIIQDMGILELDLPPIALHASTQTHNYDLDRIKFLDKVGVERIILARELSLQQLKSIRQATTAQLEYFVNGALCVSMSGQCYFSHAVTQRSANRGECSQPCRMKYDLIDSSGKVLAKNRHLLSLKDLNLSDNLKEIIDAGICSLKIEGRLKDINYIKNVTSHYRQKLDSILSDNNSIKKSSTGETDINFVPDPQRTFNRGFTTYFFGGRTKGIVNFDTPKSMGKKIGKAINISKDHFIYTGSEPLHNGDGLCFLNPKNILLGIQVNRIEGNKIYPNDISPLFEGAILYRNYDHEFAKQLKRDNAQRKIDITLTLTQSAKGLNLTAEDQDGIQSSHLLNGPFEDAQDKSMAQDNIKRQLSRSGNSIFKVKDINLELTTIPFIPAKKLNELRRMTLNALEEKRVEHHNIEQKKSKVSHPPYPTTQLSYMANIANSKAEEFYRKCGVKQIEKAFELQKEFIGKTLMTTRHCLRFEFGLCPKQNKSIQNITEPLFLRDKNNIYRLEFDCKRCEMKIILDKQK